jgi:hypothetical protein
METGSRERAPPPPHTQTLERERELGHILAAITKNPAASLTLTYVILPGKKLWGGCKSKVKLSP